MPRAAGDPSLREILFKDVHARDLPRSLRQEIRALHRFYLDEERRETLKAMGRGRRVFWIVVFLLKSLLTKLSPARRVMFAAAILFALFSPIRFRIGDTRVIVELLPWSFFLLLLVLMLELKDKLLARDEIEVARQVQLALLPRAHPDLDGWSLWSYTRPANDVGGDLVDYVDLGTRTLGVVLGDVAGKGLGAALLMAKLQATLRALAPEFRSLAELGARLNTILCRDGLDNRFATLFYLEVAPGEPRVRYLNAGHNPPFVVRTEGLEALEASARPLGMFREETYVEGSLDLAPGDLLVVYSDGLVEAQNDREEEFGVERLRRILPSLRGLPAGEAGARLLAEADRFLGHERPGDDLSLVLLARRPAS